MTINDIAHTALRPKKGGSAEKIFAFLLATILFLFLHQKFNVVTFPYDAGQYWTLADPTNFFDFPLDIRGYFYPLVLLPAHALGNIAGEYSLYAFRIYSSLIYAFTLTIVLPSFYIDAFGGKAGLVRRLIVPVLVAIFFPGVIVYTLSDLPSFVLIVGSMDLLLKIERNGKLNRKALILLALSGLLAYGAYNTRTIYLFPLVAIVLAVPISICRGQRLSTKIMATFVLLTGMGLAAVPQIVINSHRANSYTPAVISQISDKSLFALQAMWGITIQKYSTNIGKNAAPGQYFMDPAGLRLYDAEKLTRDSVSIPSLVKLVSNNPLHFIGTYTRHIINGLDLRDGEVYIRDTMKSTATLAVANFCVIFLAFWTIYLRRTKSASQTRQSSETKALGFDELRTKAVRSYALWLAILLLPVIAITPGAIETRFYLPAHFLIYCTIAFNCSAKELKDHLYSNAFLVSGIFVALFTLFFAISLNTQATQQNGVDLKYKFVKPVN